MRAALALFLLAALIGCGCGSVAGAQSPRQTTTHGQTTTRAQTTTRVRTTTRARTTPSAGPGAAITATDRLALDLLPRLGPGANAVLSPYSIEMALAMVDQGARGQTEAQIDRLLGTSSPAALAAANRALATALRAAVSDHGSGGPQLDNADSLWVQSGFPLSSSFTTSLADNFAAPPQPTDFASAPDTARQNINAWVADHTQNLIQNLMPPGTITAQTDLVLANAIYLKARWQMPFPTSLTQDSSFFPDGAPSVQVPFMTQSSPVSLPYASQSGYRAVEFPYRSSSLSLLAIMPTPGTVSRYEGGLTPARLGAIVASLRSTPLQIYLPKFTLSLHSELNGVLGALGMPLAFSNASDLSGITRATKLKIQAVEHAAVLKVDEAGTVAAAATGVSIAPTAIAAPSPTTLRLDHPFLLFLRDDATGAVLFAARVANPA